MNPKDKNKKIKKIPNTTKNPIVNLENNKNKWIWFALGVVLLTTFAIYSKAFNFDLLRIWDDQVYISQNDHIKEDLLRPSH